MLHFTLLLFDRDDQVCAVRTIRCKGKPEAAQIANVAVMAHPSSAGYQLWYCGEKVVGTYPRDTTLHPSSERSWERGQRTTSVQRPQAE